MEHAGKLFVFVIVLGLFVAIMGCTAAPQKPGAGNATGTTGGEEEGIVIEKAKETVISYGEPSNITYGTGGIAEPLRITFVNVGYGDAALIKKGDFDMLIDTGSSEVQGTRIVSLLKQLGIDDIEVLALTLPFEDHIGGVKPVLQNFAVEEIWDNGVAKDTGAYSGYLYYKDKYAPNAPLRRPEMGEKYTFNGIDVTVINPLHERKNWGDQTIDSLTMVITDDNFTLLMTDLEPNILRERLTAYYGGESNIPKVTVLKIAAHGASTLSPPIENMEYRRLINLTKPDMAVILVGPNNLGIPDLSVLGAFEATGVPIIRTDFNGTFTVAYNGTGYSVETVPQNESS